MKSKILVLSLVFGVAIFLNIGCNEIQQKKEKITQQNDLPEKDPLPSWNEGTTKQTIIDFVTRTTSEGQADYIPVADRIACFDNDGTLWSEQPFYFQFIFFNEQLKKIGNAKYISEDQYQIEVKNWLDTARHSQKNRLYTELAFQPMLELLDYLRTKEYKTFIVSGGGVDFVRVFSDSLYGIPSYQVVGSLGSYEYDSVKIVVQKLIEKKFSFNNDKEGKPIGIVQAIGKQPVIAVGNSDGDYQMLEYTTKRAKPSLGVLLHHTDSVREWAYDRKSEVGKLDRGLDDAVKNNWLLIDMKKDWKCVFPFEKESNQ